VMVLASNPFQLCGPPIQDDTLSFRNQVLYPLLSLGINVCHDLRASFPSV